MRRTALLSLFLLVPAGAASAEAGKVRLEYSRDDSASRCPDAEELRARIEARLGRESFDASAEELLRVEVRRAEGWQGTVELLDSSGRSRGRRALSSTQADCRELTQAIELAVALALDPPVFQRARPATEEPRRPIIAPTTAPAPPVAPAPSVAAPSAPAVSGARRYAWMPALAGVAAAGAGGTLLLLSRSDYNELTRFDGGPLTEREAQQFRDRGQARQTVGAVCLALGGAALVAAGVLYVTDSTPEAIALAPWGAAESAGIVFSGSWP